MADRNGMTRLAVIWLSPSLDQPKGKQVLIEWSKFAARVEAAKPAGQKPGLARWAPTRFRNAYRARANVIATCAACIDCDAGNPLEPIVEAFDGLYTIVHSTFSATPESPRWRVILPLDRVVDADAYSRVWRFLAGALEDAGVAPDYAASDASRAWAVPARPPSGYYVTRTTEGAFASVADALTAIPAPEPLPVPTRRRGDESYERRAERARRYLATMDPGIQGSNGSAATLKAAVAMVRGFALEPDDALAILAEDYNPRCLPPWSVPELRHKVKQAYQRGRMPFGAIVERGRR
jgi:hypothetical protein